MADHVDPPGSGAYTDTIAEGLEFDHGMWELMDRGLAQAGYWKPIHQSDC